MTNYTRPDEGVPYDDGVLNWVVCSHREMGFKTGEWLGNELRERGKLEPKIVVLQGPTASKISEQRGQGALKMAVEQSLRSLMLGEQAVFTWVASISSAVEWSR